MKKFRLITPALLLVIVQFILCFSLSAPAMAAESEGPDIAYSLSVEGGYTDGESENVVAGTQIRVLISATENKGVFRSGVKLRYSADALTLLFDESEKATKDESEFYQIDLVKRSTYCDVNFGSDSFALMGADNSSGFPLVKDTGTVAVFLFEVNKDSVGKDLQFSIEAPKTSTVPADFFENGKKSDAITEVDGPKTETVVAAPEGFVQFKENDPTTSRVLVKATKEFYAPFKDAVLTVTFKGNEEKTLTVILDKAYTSVTACGETVEAGEGKGFLGVVVTGIPEDVTLVSATVTFRTAEDNVVINLGSAEV